MVLRGASGLDAEDASKRVKLECQSTDGARSDKVLGEAKEVTEAVVKGRELRAAGLSGHRPCLLYPFRKSTLLLSCIQIPVDWTMALHC